MTLGDLNNEVRARFAGAAFAEIDYETRDRGSLPALGVVRYQGQPMDLRLEAAPLFTFLR